MWTKSREKASLFIKLKLNLSHNVNLRKLTAVIYQQTSHDGVDTTSITSGTENEVKKTSATGIIKIKKSSIKRKVPNFSHESDDGIAEPLLQSDKEKSETAPRSAKYLLSKTKTDSISENEDSIKMTEINISNFSASTPTTAANKVITTINTNNVKNYNNVTNVSEVTTMRNHMNTNVFCGSDPSKAIISTKSPIIVELDATKTTTYNPSLIFTTAKIHSDCKTKLMEPVLMEQVTPVPITSSTEKEIATSVSSIENKHETKDEGKTSDAANNAFDRLDKVLSKDDKSNPETDLRNSSTSKAIINTTEKSTTHKGEQNTPQSSFLNNAIGNNILSKSDAKNANFITDTKSTEKAKIQATKPNDTEIRVKSGKKDINMTSSFIKSAPESTSIDKSDKKLTVQGSKKLQRQKKATVEESQETSSMTTKDKLFSDEKKTPTISQTKTTIGASAAPLTVATSKSPSSQHITSLPTVNTKIPSQIGSIPINTGNKMQTPVSNNVTSQTTVTSKIPSQAMSIPKAITDTKIQAVANKNVKSQSIANSKIASPETTIQKFVDSKVQTPVSKIPTATSPISNTITKSLPQTSSSKTIQGPGTIKTTTSNRKGENFDSINKNESPPVTKSSDKETTPIVTETSSPVPKTLPPYIVSTSKTKIGAPVVTSATLKSEANKTAFDSKSPTNSYLVKTTPPTTTSLKTTTTIAPTPVVTSTALKSASDPKSSTNSHLSKTTPATSLKTTTTTATTPVVTGTTLKSEANKSTSDSKSPTNLNLVKTTPVTGLKTTTSVTTPVVTSTALKSASDSKSSTNSQLVKTTPVTSFKTTVTTVSTPVVTSATTKSEANKSASDSKNSSYLVKTTPASSLKTTTTFAATTTSTPSSSQGTKQVSVKQTKLNTEKQKGGGKV